MDPKKLEIRLPVVKDQAIELTKRINENTEELVIRSNEIKDETMEVLVDWLINSKINKLEISDQFNLGMLVSALKNPGNKLIFLEICDSNIGDEGMTKLAGALKDPNCKLTSLDLSHSEIGEKGVSILAEALKHPNCKLTSLDLSYTQIEEEGLRNLTEVLKDPNNKLVSLYVRDNKIGDEGMTKLAGALKHPNCKLTSLDLSWNSFGGAKELADALKHFNCKLTSLVLSENCIEDEGVAFLAEALKHSNCKLTSLDLSGNQIEDEGLRSLTEALKHPDNKLKELYMFGCDCLEETTDLAEALKHPNNRLKILELCAPEGGMGELANALGHPNCKITDLIIWDGDRLTEEDAEALSKSLKMCKLIKLRIFGWLSRTCGENILSSVVCSRLEDLYLGCDLFEQEIEEKLRLAKSVRGLIVLLSGYGINLPNELLRRLKGFLF